MERPFRVFCNEGRLVVFRSQCGLRNHVVCADNGDNRDAIRAAVNGALKTGEWEADTQLLEFLQHAAKEPVEVGNGVGAFEFQYVIGGTSGAGEAASAAVLSEIPKRSHAIGRLKVRVLLEGLPKEVAGAERVLRVLRRTMERAYTVDSGAELLIETDVRLLDEEGINVVSYLCAALRVKCVVVVEIEAGVIAESEKQSIWDLANRGVLVIPRTAIEKGKLEGVVRCLQSSNQQEAFELEWPVTGLDSAAATGVSELSEEVIRLLDTCGSSVAESQPFADVVQWAMQGRAYALDAADVSNSILVDTDGAVYASRYHRELGLKVGDAGIGMEPIIEYLNSPRDRGLEDRVQAEGNPPPCESTCVVRDFCGTYKTAQWHALQQAGRYEEADVLAWQECTFRKRLIETAIVSMSAESEFSMARKPERTRLVWKDGRVRYETSVN